MKYKVIFTEKAQKQLQLINEAYEVLSKPEKREEYNKTLQKSTISQETYNSIFEENKKLKNIYNGKNEPCTFGAAAHLFGAFMRGSKPPVLPGERERAERQ